MTEDTMASNRHLERVSLIKERKNHAIRAAAYKLFMAKDYDAITMDEVSLIAKVSKATLYKHFETKEKLYLETMHALFLERKTSIEGHHETLDAFITHYIDTSVSKKVTNLMRHCASQMIRFPTLAELAWHQSNPVLRKVDSYLHKDSTTRQKNSKEPSAQAQVLFSLIHAEIIYPVWYGFQQKHAPETIMELIKNFVLLSKGNSESHLRNARQRTEEANENGQKAVESDQSIPPLRAVYF